MNTKNHTGNQPPFMFFLFHNRSNRIMFYFSMAAIIIQFAIFKYLYPYANFIHDDSFTWLNAADKNLTIDFYPIGYSKFLRLINLFAKPDLALVAIQYLFIQCSVLFLLFTIFYFYTPGKVTQWILLILMVVNPLFLHLANLVSSDSLFLALSSTWFALLLWIIQRSTPSAIVSHAIVLALTIAVSYNALIYPAIALLAFRLSTLSLRQKIAGIGLGLLLCGMFVLFTMSQYKRLTGHWQYSPLFGWQIANNALFAYKMVDSADRKPVSAKYKEFDNIIRNYYYETRYVTFIPTTKKQWATNYYMWAPKLPLMQYSENFLKESKASKFKKWAAIGPMYKAYGLHIILKYPRHFSKHVFWPNVKRYFAPPLEVFETYNGGKKSVTNGVQAWFGYPKARVKTRMYDSEIQVLNFHPALSAVMNVIMLIGLIYYLLLKGKQPNQVFNKTLIMLFTLWTLNAVFTITVSSAALRLQSFISIIVTIFGLLLVDWMVQLMKNMKQELIKQSTIDSQFSNQVVA
jgi:hypothetical protein